MSNDSPLNTGQNPRGQVSDSRSISDFWFVASSSLSGRARHDLPSLRSRRGERRSWAKISTERSVGSSGNEALSFHDKTSADEKQVVGMSCPNSNAARLANGPRRPIVLPVPWPKSCRGTTAPHCHCYQ